MLYKEERELKYRREEKLGETLRRQERMDNQRAQRYESFTRRVLECYRSMMLTVFTARSMGFGINIDTTESLGNLIQLGRDRSNAYLLTTKEKRFITMSS